MTAETVLVVEDEQTVARGIRQTLSYLGYAVPSSVATGEQAIRCAEEMKPRLVLMDIKLEGAMDGVTAASEIRGRFGIPVVYLTSNSDESTLTRAIETRPYGYLVKPFDSHELRTAVEVALQKHDLERRLDAGERRFSTTIESIGDAVIATDSDGVVTFMNRVAESLTGWKRSEAIGKGLEDVFEVVDASGRAIENPVWEALRRPGSVELLRPTMQPRVGEPIPIDETASAILDSKGGVLGGVVVFRKVMEPAEAPPVESERRASVGGAGHAINNPLAYVISNVGFSLEGINEVVSGLKKMHVAKTHRGALDAALGRLRDIANALDDANEGADRVRNAVRGLVYESQGLIRAGDGPSRAEAPVSRLSPGRRAKLLVIDDEKAVASAMARLLGLHHEVAIENDPRAALDRIARGEMYDVIFCDLTMPLMSGIEFYEVLAAAEPAQADRIVFMTGELFSSDSRAFLGRVANATLTKPFSLDSIEAIVAEWPAFTRGSNKPT